MIKIKLWCVKIQTLILSKIEYLIDLQRKVVLTFRGLDVLS